MDLDSLPLMVSPFPMSVSVLPPRTSTCAWFKILLNHGSPGHGAGQKRWPCFILELATSKGKHENGLTFHSKGVDFPLRQVRSLQDIWNKLGVVLAVT